MCNSIFHCLWSVALPLILLIVVNGVKEGTVDAPRKRHAVIGASLVIKLSSICTVHFLAFFL